MKLPILFLSLIATFAPAFADDVQQIVERKTCEQIKSEIAELSAIATPNDDQVAELNRLKLQQRANCTIKGGGRRTISRNMPTVAEPVATVEPVEIKSDALAEYLAAKQSNCDKLHGEIEKLTADTTNSERATNLADMQRIYGADCVKSSVAEHEKPAETTEPPVPVKTEEEIAAEFDANLAAGLCGDGTKPNRFGCCPGETFKDLGDSVFACCPNMGGMCFPPIK